MINTDGKVAPAESIIHLDLNFTGEDDKPLEKLRIMTLDALRNEEGKTTK